MPTVRLVNPKTINMKRRKNSLTYVMNKRKAAKRRNPTVSVFKRRHNKKANPVHHFKRRRNPGGEITGIVEQGLLVGIGGIAARSLPTILLSDTHNSGATGYAANLGATALIFLGTRAIAGPAKASLLAAGGVAMTLARVATDMFASKLPAWVRLSGDPAFTFTRRLSGAYAQPYNFSMPFNSAPTNPDFAYAGVCPPPQLPAPPPAAAAAHSAMGVTPGLWAGAWRR